MRLRSALLALSLAACGKSDPAAPAATGGALAAPAAPVAAPAPAAPASTAKAQAEIGKGLYAKICSDCHGDAGEGGAKSPALVGPNVLPLDPPPTARRRHVQFHTVDDVARFVQRSMPPKKAGSLSFGEAYSIVAWVLGENGFDLGGPPLDEKTAPTITLH